MSILNRVLDDFIEEKLYNLHTSFIAKVISVNGNVATIKPLNKIKFFGEEVQEQSVIENVPICKHVGALEVDNVVIAVCCERDITEARRGIESIGVQGRHRINDSVIVGVIL